MLLTALELNGAASHGTRLSIFPHYSAARNMDYICRVDKRSASTQPTLVDALRLSTLQILSRVRLVDRVGRRAIRAADAIRADGKVMLFTALELNGAASHGTRLSIFPHYSAARNMDYICRVDKRSASTQPTLVDALRLSTLQILSRVRLVDRVGCRAIRADGKVMLFSALFMIASHRHSSRGETSGLVGQ